MSVFKVVLTQGTGRNSQGFLDSTTVGGTIASIQRTIWAPGPNKINRKLADGATFTDVNYWKRFSYPTLPYGQAFINVLSDDGSTWSDFLPENTFPRSYSLTVASSSVYSSNVVNVLTDNGSPAVFTQISVTTTGTAPTFRFNGLTTALMSIGNGVTQVFDKGDLTISKIEVDNSQSGSATATVNIFMSIQQSPNS